MAHPGIAEDDLRAGLSAMGGLPANAGEEMFPSGPRLGHCRVCGVYGEMTEEHLPPRGAFNKGAGRYTDPMDDIGSDELDPPADGLVVQGGIRGHVLCAGCNNQPRAREYREWANWAYNLLSSQPEKPPQIDLVAAYPAFPTVTLKGVYPGRLVRQVLSMMATVSAGSQLTTKYPVIRDLVLGGIAQSLPKPLRLEFLLYGHNTSRIAGGPQGQGWYNVAEHMFHRVLAIDFPPLAFVLTIDGPAANVGGDITWFAEVPIDEKQEVTFEDLAIGFGHKPWPCDYRTRGQMLADGESLDEDE